MNPADVSRSSSPSDSPAPAAPAGPGSVAPPGLIEDVLGTLARWRWLEATAATALLACFALCCFRFAWTTSPVFDEPFFLHAGYANLTAGAAKHPTANLIFAQNWVSLPLLASHPSLPTEQEISAVEPANRELGRLFVFSPRNDWRALLHAARPMNILLGLGLCVLVWRWSRSLFGPLGGGVSLAFCALSPLVIANSAVATTDIAATLWFAVAIYRVWALLHRVTVFNVLTCGAAAGVLLVTKISAVLLAPVALALLLLRVAVPSPLPVGWTRAKARDVTDRSDQLLWLVPAAAVSALVAVVVIWLCYAPQLTVFADPKAPAFPWTELANRPRGSLSAVAELLNRVHALPEPYLFDIRLFEVTTTVRRAYLLGEFSLGGWWYFFPLAWWFKTPIPFMLALVFGAVVLLGRRFAALFAPATSTAESGDGHPVRLYDLAPLAVFATVYLAATLTSGLNIGVRHILPIYPALFILAGALALAPRPVWRSRVLAALLAWSGIELVRASPEFLAYCNPFAGGTENGHRALIDSSYEWGQDLPAVETWLADRAQQPGPKPPVFFSYFGNADLRRFKINAILLPQFMELRPVTPYGLQPGTYIVSATMLHTLYGPAMGPWRPSYEKFYQELTGEMRRLESVMATSLAGANDLIKREGEAAWTQKVKVYDSLRFARLCAYLRKRLPDARITAGMFVFELTQDELERALVGPPAELRLDYQIRGTENLPQDQLDFIK